MLIFRNAGPESHRHLSPEQRTDLARQWNDWIESLSAQGRLQHGSPLGLAGRVITRVNGRVTDGPYAETKEAIGGYVFITAKDLTHATELATHCPGLAIGLEVEVRPVVAASPALPDVKARVGENVSA